MCYGGFMTANVKRGIVALLGGLGTIALLLGIFTKIYSFGVGLIIAIAIWIITGAIATMLGTKKD